MLQAVRNALVIVHLVDKMKAEIGFFIKTIFVIVTSITFVLIFMFMSEFRESVIKERAISEFKMDAINVLQKLVNDKECLAYEYNATIKKNVIDLEKLNKFSSVYLEIEPECGKALDFDYRVKVIQFPRDVKTHPKVEKRENCERRCYHKGYSCKTHCYDVCWEEEVIVAPSVKTSIDLQKWEFGLPVNSFSPERAKFSELQISIPISIRYNGTFATEGMLSFYAVAGELEKLYSLIEYVCEQVKAEPTKEIKFSTSLSFSIPVKIVNGKLCMWDSCKSVVCPFKINLKGFEEGNYLVNFVYSPSTQIINIY